MHAGARKCTSHGADLALSAQDAEQIQGLSVVRHNDNAVAGACPQRSQHACHEGEFARQHLPALCQAPPASSAIVKDSWQKELPTTLDHITSHHTTLRYSAEAHCALSTVWYITLQNTPCIFACNQPHVNDANVLNVTE